MRLPRSGPNQYHRAQISGLRLLSCSRKLSSKHTAVVGQNSNRKCPLPNAATLEVLRIYGDTAKGFGNWPEKLVLRLQQAGANWLRIASEYRIILKYWKKYCNRVGINYKQAVLHFDLKQIKKKDLKKKI